VKTALLFLILLAPTVAHAQTNTQLWGNVTLNWLKGQSTTLELDFEPKVLVSAPPGDPGWRSLDVTPSIERTVRDWIDIIGELASGYTKQTDHDNTFELTPRLGVHLNFLKRRLTIRDLVRVEQRNLFHTQGGTESTWRYRNRLELQLALNRDRISEDGVRYLISDWESFIPLGDPRERFANRQRIRLGLGYRHTARWRFEALYIWTRSRDTTGEPFKTSDNIVNVRLKHLF
jgi:hypothetical protein